MNFCGDCGSKITPGANFCENCGAKLVNTIVDNDFNNFVQQDSNSIVEKGIILTNLNFLSQQLQVSKDTIIQIINLFISSAAQRRIGYELVDVSDKITNYNDINEYVDLVKKLVSENHQKYLFILGSNTVIPSICWNNEASDSEYDCDVVSDLPYSTLDCSSPFYGQKYDYDQCIRVGRLPNVDLQNYFTNLQIGCGKTDSVRTFGLSAEVWCEETDYIYKQIINGPNTLTSPDYDVNNITYVIPNDTNLFLFNLHGDKQRKYWYGQRDQSYPEAMAPNSFENIINPYFLAVEACYGAAYQGRDISDSILLSTLNGKCISFLGSSRIAFGTPKPFGSCADIICGEHLKNLKNGLSAGDSLQKAREILMRNDSAETIKTLAEFALYGDPSVRMKGMPELPKGIFFNKEANKSFSKGIQVPIPDISREVRLQLIQVDQKIKDITESFVWNNYKTLDSVKGKYFGNNKGITAVFEKDISVGKMIVSVHMDAKGKITDCIESK